MKYAKISLTNAWQQNAYSRHIIKNVARNFSLKSFSHALAVCTKPCKRNSSTPKGGNLTTAAAAAAATVELICMTVMMTMMILLITMLIMWLSTSKTCCHRRYQITYSLHVKLFFSWYCINCDCCCNCCNIENVAKVKVSGSNQPHWTGSKYLWYFTPLRTVNYFVSRLLLLLLLLCERCLPLFRCTRQQMWQKIYK